MSDARGETNDAMPAGRAEREALLLSYALGGATAEEAAEARRIIADDPEAARLYAESLAIAAALPEAFADPAAVAAPPSAALKTRVMTEAAATWRSTPRATGSRRSRRPLRAGWVVAAALLVALVGLGLWNLTLQRDVRQARGDRDALRVAAAGLRAYTMAGTANAPTANATLIESAADGGKVVFLATGFPGAAPGQTYRVWLQRQDGSYVQAGTFRGGDGTTLLVLPGNLDGIHTVVIAAEPATTVATGPTGPPVMEGTLGT